VNSVLAPDNVERFFTRLGQKRVVSSWLDDVAQCLPARSIVIGDDYRVAGFLGRQHAAYLIRPFAILPSARRRQRTFDSRVLVPALYEQLLYREGSHGSRAT
jgi:hypothetical protein